MAGEEFGGDQIRAGVGDILARGVHIEVQRRISAPETWVNRENTYRKPDRRPP